MKKKTWEDMDSFTRQYAETALWSSNDWSDPDNDCPDCLDENYGIEDLSSELVEQMIEDCQDFQKENEETLEQSYETGYGYDEGQAGHDFWLTRNGHGAGFWDKGLGKLGNKLTEASKAYGSVDLYVGDNGEVYSN